MLQSEQIEELISVIAALDRDALITHFGRFRATFPVDFTREFLEAQPLDRLRHLLVALCLQQQQMPQFAAAA